MPFQKQLTYSFPIHDGTGEQGCMQRMAVSLVNFRPFEWLIVVVILANLYTIAIDSPDFRSTATDEEKLLLSRLNNFCLSVFTLEILIRACAVAGELSRWQLFEMAIVIVAWALVFLPMYAVLDSTVRCFRALRVLMLFDKVDGMQALFEAAMWSIPSLFNVGGLCAFIIGVMAVTGVQLFQGSLHHRCADVLTSADIGTFCRGAPYGGAACADGFECRHFEDNGGRMNFDSVPAATLPLLKTFLLDGWSETMYVFMSASSWQASIYFVSLVVVGGFLVMQLFLSVISEAFFSFEKRRREAVVSEQGGPQGDGLFDASAVDAEDEASSAASQEASKEVSKEVSMEGPEQPLLAARRSRSHTETHKQRLDAALAAAKRGAQQARARAEKAEFEGQPLKHLVLSAWFARITVAAVCVNIVVVCMPYHGEPEWYRDLYVRVGEGLAAFFVAEFGLKMLALGPHKYWSNSYNQIDGLLALLSVLEIVLVGVESLWAQQLVRFIRIVRLLRTMRLVRSFTSLYRVLMAIVKAIPQLRNLVVLTTCVMFIFAIVGMQIFGGTQLSDESREHFDSFAPAMLSVLSIFALGIVDLARACVAQAGVIPSVVFFVPALIVGHMGIMNLFVAILVATFSESVDETEGEGLNPEEETEAKEASIIINDEEDAANVDTSAVVAPMRTNPVAWLVNTVAFEMTIILIVLASCVCLLLDTPRIDPNSAIAALLPTANYCFTAVFTLEATLMMYVYGVRGYFASKWNVLDFVVLCCATFGLLAPHILAACTSQTSFCAETDLRALRVLRVLRPLRLLVRNPGMKAVVDTLVQTLPAVSSIIVLTLMHQVWFAAMGMLLFSGTFGSCTDPSLTTKALCDAAAAAADATNAANAEAAFGPTASLALYANEASGSAESLALSRRPLSTGTTGNATAVLSASAAILATPLADSIASGHITRFASGSLAVEVDALGVPLAGRSLKGGGSSKRKRISYAGIAWRNPPAGNFDSFGSAMLALFIATTGDNMPDLMYVGMDAKGVDVATARTEWSPAAIYFILWMLIGTFIAVNMIIGAITDKFSALRHELDGMHPLMTPAQREWVTLIRGVRTITATRRPRPPRLLRPLRLWSYRIAMSRRFEYLMYGIIMLNMLVLAADHYGMEDDEVFFTTYLWLTAAFRYAYIGEFGLKIWGLGVGGYCLDGQRQLEFLLLVATVTEQMFTSTLLPPMLLRLLRILRVFRVLRLLNAGIATELRDLLMKLVLSAPAIINVLLVLTLVMFIYAVLGVNFFCFVKPGESLNEFANFHSVPNAFLLLFQVRTPSFVLPVPPEEALRCFNPYLPCRRLFARSSFQSCHPWLSGPDKRRLARPHARHDDRRVARLHAGRRYE